MKFMFNINFIYVLFHLFCCNHTCYCVGMVSVMSASRNVHPRSDSMELAEAVPI